MNTAITPRVLVEPTSPFVPRAEASVRPAPAAPRDVPLAVTLLKNPERIVDLVVKEGAIDRVVLVSLLSVALGGAVFTNVALAHTGVLVTLKSSALIAFNFVLALAASIGPIYATGVIFAARVPLARLVATLLSSMAAGAMILAALAPVPWFLFSIDPVWKGPVGLVGAFLLAGVAAGARLKKTLFLLAVTSSKGALDEGDAFRVGILSRIALMILGLAMSLALWGFDALSPVV